MIMNGQICSYKVIQQLNQQLRPTQKTSLVDMEIHCRCIFQVHGQRRVPESPLVSSPSNVAGQMFAQRQRYQRSPSTEVTPTSRRPPAVTPDSSVDMDHNSEADAQELLEGEGIEPPGETFFLCFIGHLTFFPIN